MLNRNDLIGLDRNGIVAARRQAQAALDALHMARVRRDKDLVRKNCETLRGFFGEAWHVLEPRAAYKPNWHTDAIAEHLEAVTAKQIRRLLINVPPGSMKSLSTSVFWPAWEWGPKDMASMRYLTTSYNDGPVKRDTRKHRDLVRSEFYREMWPDVVLTRTGETSFANSQTGTREGVAFGSLTSQRGDRLIIDDPHSTETAESDVERQNTTRKFREGALNRVNDEQESAIIVIMQRLHMDDVSGVIEQFGGMDFDRLIIPMEFDPERRLYTSIGWTDPRTDDGDLMFPERFPRAVLDAKQIEQGEYAYAGQYQQLPAPREGGMFRVDQIEIVDVAPIGGQEVRGWDLAGTKKKTSPYTAGVKMKKVNGTYYILDARRTRKEVREMPFFVETVARADDADTIQDYPQDPGVGGKSLKIELANRLDGLRFYSSVESGDKVVRATPLSSQVDAGNVKMVRGTWNKALIEEMRHFPAGSFKDQVDAMSRAYLRIQTFREEDAGAPPESPDAARDVDDEEYGDEMGDEPVY